MTQAIRDRLVAGIRSEVLQRQLLSKETLTLDDAVKLSQAYEAAELNVKALKSSATDTGVSDSVGKVVVNKPSTGPCYRCGKGNHTPEECRFKTAKCHNCGRTGHISPVCRSSTRPRRGDNSKKPSKRRTKYVAVDDSSSNHFHFRCGISNSIL